MRSEELEDWTAPWPPVEAGNVTRAREDALVLEIDAEEDAEATPEVEATPGTVATTRS
jgi:hypothetical protein